MTRSLSILVGSILIVGFLTLSTVRITPPGGLLGSDYLLMCALPIAAYFAGKSWHNGPVFLFYGMLGMLTFVPGYLADGRLGLKFLYGNSTVIGDVLTWVIGVLIVAVTCNVLGKLAREPVAESSTTEHEL